VYLFSRNKSGIKNGIGDGIRDVIGDVIESVIENVIGGVNGDMIGSVIGFSKETYTISKRYVSHSLHILLDKILNIKLWITSKYNEYFPVKEFILEDVELYFNLDFYKNVKSYFLKYCKNGINMDLMENILEHYNTSHFLKIRDYQNMRLKIKYIYMGKKGILYYSYLPIIERNEERNIPYPPYTEKIVEDYKKDIIHPFYPELPNSKLSIYPFFTMDCKDVKDVLLYKENMNHYLLKYIQQIQSPFYDFGLLYDCPVRLAWVFAENNFDIYNHLRIKFIGFYLNEETMTLEDLEMNVKDIFIMKETRKIIETKNKLLNKYMKIPE